MNKATRAQAYGMLPWSWLVAGMCRSAAACLCAWLFLSAVMVAESTPSVEEMHERQARQLDSILRSAPTGIGMVENRVFTQVNQYILDLTGYSREELVGKSARMVYPSDEEYEFVGREKYRQIAERGTGMVETRWLCKDGSICNVLLSSTPLDPSDLSVGVTFTVLDITARKQAEAAIVKSAEFTNSLLRAIPVAVFFKDKDGRYLGCNKTFTELMGVSQEEISGKTVHELWPSEHAKVYHQHDLELMRTGQHQSYEFKVRDKNGRERPVLFAKDVFRDANGQVEGMVGAFVDLTGIKRAQIALGIALAVQLLVIVFLVKNIRERRRALRELREKSEEVDRYFDSSLDLLCIADTNGYFRRLNPEWEYTLGYSSKDMENTRFLDLVHPDDLEVTRDSIRKIKQNEKLLNFENRYRRKDGSYRWIEWRSQRVGDLIYAAARDVTERKQANSELARQKQELDQQNRLLTTLLKNLQVGVFMVEAPTGKPLIANLKALELLGRGILPGITKENLSEVYNALKLPGREPYPVDEMPIVMGMKGASGHVDDMLVVRPDGTETLLEIFGSPVLDATGKVAASLVSFFDITERKAAEAALRESQGKLSALFASMAEMVVLHEVVFDAVGKAVDYRITDCNTAFTRITGIRRAAAVGKLASEVYGCQPAPYLKEFTDVGITGKPYTFETYYPAMGKHFLISVVSPGKDKFATVTTDITERKQAEDALNEARQLLRNVLDTVPARVFWKDPHGRYLGCNLSCAKDAGLNAPEEVIGKDDNELGWREQAEKYRADDRRVLETGQPKIGYEEPQTTPEGKRIWLRTSKVPLVDHQGKTIGVLGSYEDITAEREQQEALRRSEENLAITLNSIGDAVIATDIESRVTRMNPVASQLTGWHEADAVGRPLREVFNIVNANTGVQVNDPVEQVLATGQIVGLANHTMLLAKDGAKYQIADSAAPIHGRDGKVQGVVLVFRDVTKEYAMREALDHERAQLLSLFDSIDAAIYVSDIETYEILYANSFIQNKSTEALVGKKCHQALQGLGEKCPFCTNEKILELGGEPYKWEYHNSKFGMHFQITDRLIRWPDGRNVRFEMAVDITARKQAEERLAAEKERLAVTLRSIGDGVITTDMQGIVVLLNRVAEELTGWSQDEAAGRPLAEVFNIIHEQTRKPCESPVARVLASGEIIELENHTLLMARNGDQRMIADSGAPIKDKDSRIIGVVLVFRDMTEKQRLLDEVQKSQRLEALGALAGGIAHDFNNLLGGIFGCVEIARLENRDAEVAARLDEAMNAMDRARALTRELLTFAKGGAPIKAVQYLFPTVQDAAQFALRGSAVACSFSVPGDLWPCLFDSNQLCQVVDNLVINARQAMDGAGRIEISGENVVLADGEVPNLRAGRYVRITVRDYGPGIPPELQRKIFDPFFSTKHQGHGLGLSTSYSIIQRHEGAIIVDSQPGIGAAFNIYLPAASGATADARRRSSSTHRGQGCFLVMDDEPIMEKIMPEMLGMFGYSAVMVGDGEAALRVFAEAQQQGVHFVGAFLDLTIPGGMGGVEAAKRFLAQAPDLPLFVMSGYSDDPVMASPDAFGFRGSICKPFTVQELSNLLNRHFG